MKRGSKSLLNTPTPTHKHPPHTAYPQKKLEVICQINICQDTE